MAEVISRRSLVFDILFEVESGKKSAKQAEQELDKLGKTANKVSGSFKALGGVIAAAFTAQQVAQFTKEAFELGLKAEGVTKAFKQLGNGKLLDDLRKATKGTVEDLTLMQAAVRADKFKIPLNELSKLLKFAQVRARETGQSVEFLANSIVDGIGRKSPLILDNLGLSAAELSEEFKKTGDFAKAAGNIITREMAKGGKELNLTSDKVDRLRASFANFQQRVGTILVNIAGQFASIFEVDQQSPIRQTINGLEQTREGLLLNLRALEDTNLSQDARNQLIEETNRLYGPYLKNINLEKASASDLVRIQKELNDLFKAKIAQVAFEAELAEIAEKQATAARGQLNIEIQRAKLDANRLNLTKEEIAFQENLIRIAEELNKQVLSESEGQINNLNDSFKRLLQTLNLSLSAVKGFGVEASSAASDIKKAIDDEFTEDAPEFLFQAPETATDEFLASIRQKNEDFLSELERTSLESADRIAEATKIKALEQQEAFDQIRQQGIDAAIGLGAAFSQFFDEQSSQAKALALITVISEQAKGLAAAAATAMKANNPIAALAFLPVLLGSVLSVAAQARGLLNQANAVQLAEGEIDIHRKGEKRGKDSIPALLMPGESVMTTEETKKYKPLLEAIRSGNLEDLIRINYVDPAIATAGLEYAIKDSRRIPDYSERMYRQLLEEKENNTWNKKIYKALIEDKGRVDYLRSKRKF